MPDPSASDFNLLNWLWATFSVPIAWLWHKGNRAQDTADAAMKAASEKSAAVQADLDQHKLHLAHKHFEKEEVKEIIRGTVRPIEESVMRIEASVNKLIDREMGAVSGANRRGDLQ